MSKCAEKCEVYSRVCGYFRPVSNWNKGKKEEFKERKMFTVGGMIEAAARAAGKTLGVLALAVMLSGCLVATRATVTEYDKDGKVCRVTETSESVVGSITKSTANKTVVAWESGWAAYISASTATMEEPTPTVRMFAGKTDKGVISALPGQQDWTGIARTVTATKYALEVSPNGVKSE